MMTTQGRSHYDRRDEHMALLDAVLDMDITERQRDAFQTMRDVLASGRYLGLTENQAKWVKQVHDANVPTYENAWSAGSVPRGADVPTPPALRDLPKRPPHRRHEVES